MSIMQRVDEELHVSLEGILICVVASGDILLDLLQALKNVNTRLLVALRRMFEIGEIRLKLQSYV
jgi:hypothetical protein